MSYLDFGILGPFEVWRDGDRVPIEAARERAVLAVLLLSPNRVVAADRLTELVWGEDVPPRARNTVHTLMWRLRRRLQSPGAADVLITRPPGYLVQIERNQLDLHRFEDLVKRAGEARTADRVEEAERLFGAALQLWRGQPLADVAAEGLRRIEVPRLAELYLQTLEARIDARLALGRHLESISELRGLVADHPLREAISGQLMVALYRSGRQAEALETYRALRRMLAEELGVEPGPTLQRLHQAVLRADESLDLPRTAREAAAGAPQRPEPGATAPRDAGEAAPPRPASTVPAQLPGDVAAFTGRAEHVRQLDDLLDDGPATAVVIAVIAGTAGVGKTALAVHWAHRVRDRFDGGQLYVNLRGYSTTAPMRPIDALSRFLRALGVPAERIPVDVEEAASLYRTLLADRRMLIVLDNARGPEQVRPLLPGSPNCVVLITSRDRLGGLVAREGAYRLTLDVLAPQEAHTLLTRMLGADRVQAEPAATVELAQACAHLPLALRIAAANLSSHAQFSVADYQSELRAGNRLAALEVEGDEETAVRAAFDLSYTGLPPEARAMFRLLGLVPGPDVSTAAAAALAEMKPRDAGRWLEQLATAHLIDQHVPGRYAFHDLLRLYARERFDAEHDEPDRAAAAERLFEFYLYAVDAAARLLYPEKLRLPLTERCPPPVSFDDHTTAAAWLDAERSTLVAAIGEAAEHGPRHAAWQLADALRGYFYLRMYTVDWLAAAHAALVAARTEGDHWGQAAAHISLADLDWRHSHHRQAIDHYAQALSLSRQIGWMEGQATALGNLGTVYWQSGRLGQAAEQYEEALAINRRTGWLEGQAINLLNLAAVHWLSGRLAEAAESNTQALALNRKIGSRSGEGITMNNLGETYHLLGRLDQALDQLTQALAVHREIRNRATEGETLRCLAAVHRDAGRLPEALDLAHAALTHAEETGDRRHRTDAHNMLATIHDRLGDHRLAADHHQQALRLASETSNQYLTAESLIGLAAAHLRLGEDDKAMAYGHQALTVARADGYRVLEGQALTALAAIHRDRAEVDQAAALAQEALAVHAGTGHRLGLARAHVVLGDVLARSGQAASGRVHWQEALSLFADIGSPEADEAQARLAP